MHLSADSTTDRHIPTLARDFSATSAADSPNLFLQASEASAAGITIADCSFPDMPLVYVNPAFVRMTGYTAEEVLGRNCRFLQGARADQPALHELRAALREGRDCAVLLYNIRKDGAVFWNDLVMAPIRDVAGTLTHYIGIQNDATARVEAEMALQRANHDLERRVSERVQDLTAANAALLEAQYETLDRLARAAEWRDDDTGQHTQRVGRMCGLLAEALGWQSEDVWRIERAAVLHDVGKIGVPDEILLKPGRLTSEELARMKHHTVAGAAILAGGKHRLLQIAEAIALSHHEWWDGSGYPHGLARQDIPPEARIVAVADVFDALTHARPYKEAWPVIDAVMEIARYANKQFDPAVVDAFLRLYRDGRLPLPDTTSVPVSATCTAN